MRVSHETIYMALYVQGRGALGQEVHRAPRSGRALRRPKKSLLLSPGLSAVPNVGFPLVLVASANRRDQVAEAPTH
jgi:hypothetical protein